MNNHEKIREIIAAGAESLDALKEAKEHNLKAYLEEFHAACDAAAIAYKKSYDDDVYKAAELLGKAEDEAAAIQIKIAKVNATMPQLLVKGDSAEIEKIEEETKELEDQLREKEKRIKLLQNYRPTGDEELYKAATAGKEQLVEAYMIARKSWAQLVQEIREKKKELEYMASYIGSSYELGNYKLDAVSSEKLKAMHDKGAFLGDVINNDDKISKEHAARVKAFKEQRQHLKEMGIDLDK